MTHLVVRIDDELAVEVDRLVDAGVVASRSDAVRRGLLALVDVEGRRAVGAAIVEGYRRRPQTGDGLGWGDDMTVSMIGEESW